MHPIHSAGSRRRRRRIQPAFHRLQQPFHRERLADVIDHAQILGVGLVPAAFVGRDHDDRRGVGLALEMLQHRVASHARHHHVENDQIGVMRVHHLLALLAVASLHDTMALPLQQDAQAVA